MKKKNQTSLVINGFSEHITVAQSTLLAVEKNIESSAKTIANTLSSGGTVFWCGNGGSAADSQHIAADFVGRFKKDRKPLRSIALTTDSSIITCISNDFSFREVFSRQLNALGKKGDVLVAISTSGQSENIRQALIQAKKMKIKTIGLFGNKGGVCKDYTNISIIVPSDVTTRIQEIHILIEHLLCELVEKKLGLD